MARQPRFALAHHPYHLIQRGNDRQAVVRDDDDRRFLRQLWFEEAHRFGVALHAYVLMDNHFHLLATPEREGALSQWMQSVGRTYVRRFNQRHGRSGTLWEGRFKSSLIQTERYFLACMVYLDLNPVRAQMVAEPADHAWSSHRHYIGVQCDTHLSPHALYWGLGNTPFAREVAYAELVRAGVSDALRQRMTRCALSGWAMGSEAYLAELQQTTLRRQGPGQVGRPRKPA